MMLWTTQAMISAYSLTGRNQIRDEAVRLVGEFLTDYRNTPYSSLAPGTVAPLTINRQIRNFDQTFTVNSKITSEVPGIAFSVEVKADWTHNGSNYNYTATTIVGDK
jgi:hypothetical protein